MHKWVNLEVDHKTYSQSRTSSSSVCTGLTLQPDRRTWWGVTQEVTHGQRLKGQIQKFKSDKYNILQTVYAWHVISRLISTWRYQDSEKLCSYSKYRCPSYLGASSTGLSLTSIQTSVTLKHRGKVMMEEAYDHLLKYPTHKHKTEEIRNKIRGQGHPELPVRQPGSLALVWFIWREPSDTWKPQSDFTDETFSRKTGTKNLKQQPLRLLLFLVSSSEKKTREESGSKILSSGAPSHLSPYFTQCRWSSVFFIGCRLVGFRWGRAEESQSTLTLCPFIPGSPGVPGNPRAPCESKQRKYDSDEVHIYSWDICSYLSVFHSPCWGRCCLTWGPGTPLSPGLPGLPLLPCDSTNRC